MEKVKYIIIAGTALVTAIAVFVIFSHSEEAKVKKQFKYLAQKMKKTPGEITLTSAAKANRIRDLFTEKCTIYAPAYSFSKDISSQGLPIVVMASRSPYSKISLKFHDFVIDFPKKDRADVNLTARMKGKRKKGEYSDGIHELKCKLKKIKDTWLLEEIEMVEVLEK
jgi:hypothetical protein